MTIFLISFASVGCTTTPIDTPIGCPAYPDVLAYQDEEAWDLTPEQIRETIVHNEAAWEAWYDKACGRIRAHDEMFPEQ